MDEVAGPDLEDPNPDVWELFRHYDALYFRGALAGAEFSVRWSSPGFVSSSFGSCTFTRPTNTIILSEPVLQYRSNADLKNALLHEMIHAILFVKHHRKDHWEHGPIFRAWMDAINSSSMKDYQRPPDGYNITTRHDFCKDKSTRSINGILWKCEHCEDTLVRASSLGCPSDACCIENVDYDLTCGNMLCNWHAHKMNCGGEYTKTGGKPTQAQAAKRCRRRKAIQESDSDESQENATVMKTNAKDKLLPLVVVSNAKSPGSSSTKKSGKRLRPEDTHKASVLPDVPPRNLKLKEDFMASVKRRQLSLVGCNNADSPGGSTSKKESKGHTTQNIGKSSVLAAAPLRNLKPKQEFVVSEKRQLLSVVGCDNAKSPGGSTSNKESKRHTTENVQKSSVMSATPPKKPKLMQNLVISKKNKPLSPVSDSSAPLKKPKLMQNLVISEKNELLSPVCDSSAPPKKPKLMQNLVISEKNELLSPVCESSAPPKKPKLMQNLVMSEKNELLSPVCESSANLPGSRSLKKVGKRLEPEGVQKTSVLPATPIRKPKQECVASDKNEVFSLEGCRNAKVLGSSSSKNASKHQKTIVLPAAPQSKRKHENEIGSSIKAGMKHKRDDIQKTNVQLVSPQSKFKQSNLAAPEKQNTRYRTRKAAKEKEKEYAVISAWLNYYESEQSSGSTEPLINKRTERRKRAGAQITCYSRSRKRSIKGNSSVEAQPSEDVSSHRQAAAPCLDIVLAAPPAEQMATQDPGDQSQPPAPCWDMVPVDAADIIEISDED